MSSLLRLSVFLSVTLGVLAQAAPLVRITTYNASLNRNATSALISELSETTASQPRQVAEIIQIIAPDILLLNEFDYDPENQAIDLFHENYLQVGQNGQTPITYPYRYSAPSNTGVPSGQDFDNNGSTTDSADGFGFGDFPGQFGMAVFSKHPIDTASIRTFQNFLWKDMPNSLLPTNWYSQPEQDIFRLSSKSHWDLPIQIAGTKIHLLTSHPTPPVFDGPEDRNGRRNHDEIRLWADYLTPSNSSYIYDDSGTFGGLPSDSRFVIMGDQNADPLDGDSVSQAINQLLNHPSVNDPLPASGGGARASRIQGGVNNSHDGDPTLDTADFSESASGNIRVDYVLPSHAGFEVTNKEVYWPTTNPGRTLITASDHRPVTVDFRLIPLESEAFQDIALTISPPTLTWKTNANITYTIESSTDLSTQSWNLYNTTQTENNGVTSAPLHPDLTAVRFYRLRASYPE